MLHMFATGESVVYKELLNSFYRSNYSSICSRYEEEASRRKQNWKAEKVLIGRYKRTVAASEITGSLIIMNPVPLPGTKLLGAIVKLAAAGESEACKRYVYQTIEDQRDRSIAETCARKAKEQLNQKESSCSENRLFHRCVSNLEGMH